MKADKARKPRKVELTEIEAAAAEQIGMSRDEFAERRDALAKKAGMSPERYAALREVTSLADYRRVVEEHGPGRGW